MEKFRKFRFADVGKSELGKIKMKHAQHIRSTVHRTGDLIISTDINSVSDIATLIKDVGDALKETAVWDKTMPNASLYKQDI